MTGKLSGNSKLLILSLLLLGCLYEPLVSQAKINGIINKYGRVTTIGTDNVIIGDATQFAQFLPGDTVMLIQMKGVRIYTLEISQYGISSNAYGAPGMHEFLTILSVEPGTRTITFRNDIAHKTPAFNVEGDVQLVRVPSYHHATVDALLTCAPWDSISKTGGILAVITGRTLSLNANIDVTGKGFKGGTPVPGFVACGSTDLKLDMFSYPLITDSAGMKGESPAVRSEDIGYPKIYPGFALGKGANLTGGGGGNGKYSGGGGGANYGNGGKGGRELNTCPGVPVDGGLGGRTINGTLLDPGIFLGGGGGASTFGAGGNATSGGKGGGIVFIMCDIFEGNGFGVYANGESVTNEVTGNAGAGGGGGGGSIVIYTQSFSTTDLTLSAKGGKGGNNTLQSFGEGGGGGGGLINTSISTTTFTNVVKDVTGGDRGVRNGTESADPGTAAVPRSNFVPFLNGFLFNSIGSSGSGNQVDSICSNVVPKQMNGTTPVGGSGDYTFLWQKSYNLTGPATNIAGSNVKDFTPFDLETDTVWFRRVVTDNVAVPVLSDTSKWVEIRVHTAITGNLVGKDSTICYNQIPVTLGPLNAGPSNGNGYYTYRWVQNNDNLNWPASPDATGTATIATYDPPALTDTTYYKRIVTSGQCIDYSSTITMTVLPLITGNIMARPDSVICEGTLFNTLDASAPGGGAGTGSYKYLWQDSVASASWIAAPGVRDISTYTVDTSYYATEEHRYFRRIIYSGPDSVCSSKSLPIKMTRYHLIENNTISKDTTICSGSVPPEFTGSTPLKGSGTYTYMWQDSTEAAVWVTRGTLISPFAPPALTDTTWYRRIVNSSKCSDTSAVLVIRVHKPITNNIASLLSGPGPDTTICSGAVPNKILGSLPGGGTDIPGDYAYLWFSSADNFTTTNVAVATAGTLADYQPGALTVTTSFRRKVISGKCETYSNPITINVLPLVTNNVISSTQAKVCYGTVPLTITGTPLTGGAGVTPTWLWQQSADGVTWTTADGATSGQQSYSPPALTDPVKYRRIILSGPYDCCQDTSNTLDMGIFPLPTGILTTTNDTTICSGSQVVLGIQLTGATPWNVVYNENTTQVIAGPLSAAINRLNRIPVPTASVSTFNYSFASITDNNNCSATAALMTGSRHATVYKTPVANAGNNGDICGDLEYQLQATPTDGTGTWTWKPATPLLLPYPVAFNDKVKIDESSITDANDKYKFYWEEQNWQCISKDSVEITFHNPVDPITAGNDTTIHSIDYLIQLNATPLKAWETGMWEKVSGEGSFDDPSSNQTNVRDVASGTNKYKWKVKSGSCDMVEDEIVVIIMAIEIPQGISPNNDPDNYNNTLNIRGLDLRTNPDGSPAYQQAELKIVNGVGTQVFATSNFNGNEWKDWDGTDSSGKDLPEGTYYYLLKIMFLEVEAEPQKFSGFIILKRY